MKVKRGLSLALGLTQVLVAAGLVTIYSTGCKPASEKAAGDLNSGDSAMASGNLTQAVDDYQTALDQAEKAKTEAAKNNGTFDTAPYEQKLAAAKAAASQEASKRVDQARGMAATDPFGAQTILDQAQTLASQRYGNNSDALAAISQIEASPQMLPVRISRKMDEVTDSINNWLFWQNWYDSYDSMSSVFTISNYVTMRNKFNELDQMLSDWQAQGGSVAASAKTQLASTVSSLDRWRQWQIVQAFASGGVGREVADAMIANFLIEFVTDYSILRATLRGTSDLNYYALEQNFGVSYDSGRYTYYSTGNGNVRRRPGYGSTGDGNSGGGYSNTGGGDTGGGYSNTGGGDTGGSYSNTGGGSTSSGRSSTGNGDRAPRHRSSTGTGGGDSNYGTSSTGSGDSFGDLNRSGGSSSTGSGTSSSRRRSSGSSTGNQ